MDISKSVAEIAKKEMLELVKSEKDDFIGFIYTHHDSSSWSVDARKINGEWDIIKMHRVINLK
jgi:hypothetical protein